MTKTRRAPAKNCKKNGAKTPANVGIVADKKSENLPEDKFLLEDQ